jgi:hypothetical protein
MSLTAMKSAGTGGTSTSRPRWTASGHGVPMRCARVLNRALRAAHLRCRTSGSNHGGLRSEQRSPAERNIRRVLSAATTQLPACPVSQLTRPVLNSSHLHSWRRVQRDLERERERRSKRTSLRTPNTPYKRATTPKLPGRSRAKRAATPKPALRWPVKKVGSSKPPLRRGRSRGTTQVGAHRGLSLLRSRL